MASMAASSTSYTIKYDLTDQRFGMVVALEHVGLGSWLCSCDCGNSHVIRGAKLRAGSQDAANKIILLRGEIAD